MEEKKLVEDATKFPTPSECIEPKLDPLDDYQVRSIREDERATRISLNICRDIYKILYFAEYTISPKSNNRWWAENLCSTGEIAILRSITKESARWSSLALRLILRYLKTTQSISQLAQNAPELFTLLFQQSLSQTATEVSQAQTRAAEEWKKDGLVSYGYNEEAAYNADKAPTHRPLVPNLIQKVYDLANATLDRFTETGAVYHYDSLPLLEAEDIHDLLTPEMLALGLVTQSYVLSQEKTLSMDMYLDFSGSMGSTWHKHPELDNARACGLMADILWRYGIIQNVYLFNSHVHEVFKDERGILRKFQRPQDFLSIPPCGGTDFTNILRHSGHRPAIIFTDGDAMADPSAPMNPNLMWVVFCRGEDHAEYLYRNPILKSFIDRGRVIGISQTTAKVFEIYPPKEREL